MKLSEHFDSSEFACKCGCGFDTPDKKLIDLLQEIRTRIGKPVIINSGCRCESHNHNVGGSTRSQHVQGKAADIRSSVSPDEISYVANEILGDQGGVKAYETFCHVDVRDWYWRG